MFSRQKYSPSFSASLARSAAWSNDTFFEPANGLVFFVKFNAVTCTGTGVLVSCDAAEDSIVVGLESSLGTTGVVDVAAGDLGVEAFVLLVVRAIFKQF
jgi:hypothetical protein